jgi:tol-pal system protein YbgF
VKKVLFLAAVAALLGVLLWPSPAVAQKQRDILIQVQRDVTTLQQQLRDLQQSVDRNSAVLKTLIEQAVDAVNHMGTVIDGLEQSVQQAQARTNTRVNSLVVQVQSLRDTVDEVGARLGRISQQLAETQGVMRSVDARLATTPPPAPVEGLGGPGAAVAPPTGTPAQTSVPSAQSLYDTALRDFIAGNYDLSQQQFNDYLRYYGRTELAGNAQFYLGEVQYRQHNYRSAIENYNRVFTQYSNSNKIPAALLKKGYALLELKQQVEGVRVLRRLLEKYPRSDQAPMARARLRRLGAIASR